MTISYKSFDRSTLPAFCSVRNDMLLEQSVNLNSYLDCVILLGYTILINSD